ncbi:hypothetical protein HD554DRAFT_2039036 [Boletus coccyginus]|nr:hypothetical protein HD554DRAFT_2039036 [Boletus coccyginus]
MDKDFSLCKFASGWSRRLSSASGSVISKGKRMGTDKAAIFEYMSIAAMKKRLIFEHQSNFMLELDWEAGVLETHSKGWLGHKQEIQLLSGQLDQVRRTGLSIYGQ